MNILKLLFKVISIDYSIIIINLSSIEITEILESKLNLVKKWINSNLHKFIIERILKLSFKF